MERYVALYLAQAEAEKLTQQSVRVNTKSLQAADDDGIEMPDKSRCSTGHSARGKCILLRTQSPG